MAEGRSPVAPPSCGSDRIPNPTRGEDRDSSVDDPGHRPSAAPRARGARTRGDSYSRGPRGALGHFRGQREACQFLAALAPQARARNPAHTGAHRIQLIAAGSETCRRSRLTLSVVLDGEASAVELAEVARHLPRCEDCARFAAVVAELKQRLRAASFEELEAPQALQRRRP